MPHLQYGDTELSAIESQSNVIGPLWLYSVMYMFIMSFILRLYVRYVIYTINGKNSRRGSGLNYKNLLVQVRIEIFEAPRQTSPRGLTITLDVNKNRST